MICALAISHRCAPIATFTSWPKLCGRGPTPEPRLLAKLVLPMPEGVLLLPSPPDARGAARAEGVGIRGWGVADPLVFGSSFEGMVTKDGEVNL
jgi:hypothetical protein